MRQIEAKTRNKDYSKRKAADKRFIQTNVGLNKKIKANQSEKQQINALNMRIQAKSRNEGYSKQKAADKRFKQANIG